MTKNKQTIFDRFNKFVISVLECTSVSIPTDMKASVLYAWRRCAAYLKLKKVIKNSVDQVTKQIQVSWIRHTCMSRLKFTYALTFSLLEESSLRKFLKHMHTNSLLCKWNIIHARYHAVLWNSIFARVSRSALICALLNLMSISFENAQCKLVVCGKPVLVDLWERNYTSANT